MLGQSFFPGGDEQQRMQEGGAGPVNPVQEAIKVLSLKLPRFLGNAPAPPQLLTSLGGGGMPTNLPGAGGQPDNPLVTILQRLFMPGQMGGPSPSTDAFKPKVEYADPRGALPFTPTVQPTAYENEPAPSEPKPPMTTGGRRVFSV